MDNDLMQRKLLLASLLESKGFSVLEKEMEVYIEGQKVLLDNATSTACKEHVFNFLTGKLAGLKEFNNVIAGFREELEQLADER